MSQQREAKHNKEIRRGEKKRKKKGGTPHLGIGILDLVPEVGGFFPMLLTLDDGLLLLLLELVESLDLGPQGGLNLLFPSLQLLLPLKQGLAVPLEIDRLLILTVPLLTGKPTDL